MLLSNKFALGLVVSAISCSCWRYPKNLVKSTQVHFEKLTCEIAMNAWPPGVRFNQPNAQFIDAFFDNLTVSAKMCQSEINVAYFSQFKPRWEIIMSSYLKPFLLKLSTSNILQRKYKWFVSCYEIFVSCYEIFVSYYEIFVVRHSSLVVLP